MGIEDTAFALTGKRHTDFLYIPENGARARSPHLNNNRRHTLLNSPGDIVEFDVRRGFGPFYPMPVPRIGVGKIGADLPWPRHFRHENGPWLEAEPQEMGAFFILTFYSKVKYT